MVVVFFIDTWLKEWFDMRHVHGESIDSVRGHAIGRKPLDILVQERSARSRYMSKSGASEASFYLAFVVSGF